MIVLDPQTPEMYSSCMNLQGTLNLDFKVTIFLYVKYLNNVTRQSYTYNGRLIGSRIWSSEQCHF